jgi:hypothetical protein
LWKLDPLALPSPTPKNRARQQVEVTDLVVEPDERTPRRVPNQEHDRSLLHEPAGVAFLYDPVDGEVPDVDTEVPVTITKTDRVTLHCP